MGLDMYLTKETYVKNWDHMTPAERHVITIAKEDGSPTEIKPERISEIVEQVAYWRKANHIHAWFVKNVQDGKDECQKAYVSKEQLAELIAACNAVLTDKDKAATLLPTQPGFFFGGIEYGEYYMGDCENTVKMLTPLLTETDGGFYYQSSW